jgi:hypothetical protein
MSPHEEEIRARASQTPFIPFALVTSSGERIKVSSGDHIFFNPNTDEQGHPLPERQWSDVFIVWGNGRRHRVVFFDAITHLDMSAL